MSNIKIVPAKKFDFEENDEPFHLRHNATFLPEQKEQIATIPPPTGGLYQKNLMEQAFQMVLERTKVNLKEMKITADSVREEFGECLDIEIDCWKNKEFCPFHPKSEEMKSSYVFCSFNSPVDCWFKKESCAVHPKSENVKEICKAFEEDYKKTIQRNEKRTKILNKINEEIKKRLEKIKLSDESEDCPEERSLTVLYENLEVLTSLYDIAVLSKNAYGDISWDWIEGIWDFIFAHYPSFQAKKAHAEHSSYKFHNDFNASFAVFSAWKNEYIEQAKLSDSHIEKILKFVDEQLINELIKKKEAFDPEWVEKRKIDKTSAIQFFKGCLDEAKLNLTPSNLGVISFSLEKRKNKASLRRELIVIANGLLEEPLKKRKYCERAWDLFNNAMGIDAFTSEKAYNIYIALAPGDFKTPPLTEDYHPFITSEESLNNFLDSTYEKIDQD